MKPSEKYWPEITLILNSMKYLEYEGGKIFRDRILSKSQKSFLPYCDRLLSFIVAYIQPFLVGFCTVIHIPCVTYLTFCLD
jgi:hypothetical protein